MTMESRAAVSEYVITPLKSRILIRKDEGRKQTRGGIVLPDDSEIPTITGRVVEISPDLEDCFEFPVKKYDKVLVDPSRSIPVDLEPDNKLFIIPAKDVVAVFRKRNETPND